MLPASRNFRDAIQARSLDKLIERIKEAIELCLEVEATEPSATEFTGSPARYRAIMPRLPRLRGCEVIAALHRAGFSVLRVRGSHHFLRHSDGRRTVVPVHAGETIGPGLLSKILKDVEMDMEEFTKWL